MNEIEKTKIREYIEELNAKSWEWVKEDPTNRLVFTTDVDSVIDMLEKYTDVSNLEEYKQYSAWEEYSEVFKSKNGFRPRWTSWKENSAESWDKMINNLYSVKKNGELP